MADVTFQHDEYRENVCAWEMVEDAVSGQDEVKEAGEKYLPMPNPKDRSTENHARYEQYKARAVYYNITRRTLQGLIGASFSKAPTTNLAASIAYALDDIDGRGISVFQQAQAVLSDVLQKGRACLLVDYPRTTAPASVADMQSGAIRATTVFYEAEDVVNWRMDKIGAKHVLSLVVIKEDAEQVTDDGFGIKCVGQYRVLRLIGGVYAVETYRQNDKKDWVLFDGPNYPTDSTGRTWSEIPFTFVGSLSNSDEVDPSPLFDLAVLNLAHYRNSADYEDSVFMVGQPQAWISGLSEEWRDWLQKEGIYVGARSAILLPENGAFGFAQAQPNTLAKEAMDAKEHQMRAIGARLIEPGSAVKTATQAQAENEQDHSVLSLAAGNVSEAYTKCLLWMTQFMGTPTKSEFALHVDPQKFSVDGVMLGALVAANQAGKLPDSDLFRIMRKLDVIDPEKTDAAIAEELTTTSGPALPFGA